MASCLVKASTTYSEIITYRLWMSGQMNFPVGNEIFPSELEMYGVEGVITNEFIADNGPIFSTSTEELLTNNLLNILKYEIPYSNCPSNHGIES